jgi:hypothetical protein
MVGRKLRLVLLEKQEKLQAEAERKRSIGSQVTANGGCHQWSVGSCVQDAFANWVWRASENP